QQDHRPDPGARRSEGRHRKKLTAHLDAAAGVEYDGETLPALSDAEHLAFKVASLLKTGTGGLNWAGLPLIAGWLGCTDPDGLLERLAVIALYQKPKET
ncbi:MAG: hypothetical protein KA806_10515, partial [Sulfuritalea sp.]|nr:hypothetical protein [Sulfuritalea sp.]